MLRRATTTACLLALGLSAGVLSGCGEDYLDVKPTDAITDANFYKTQEDALQAVTACYSELAKGGQYNWALWGIGDIMADNSTTGGGGGGDGLEQQQLDFFRIPTNNLLTTRLWEGCYVGIGRCNIVLQKVPDIRMDASLRTRCLGEARFLRAKYYFDLVRCYGDVPLLTTPPANLDESRIGRTPAAAVYDQIKKDLTDAIGELPASYSGNDVGRATKWAAMGLLAKVHLTLGEMGPAATLADDIIQNSGKSLWADYGDNFKVANENGKESLFEVQYVGLRNSINYGFSFDDLGCAMNTFFGPRGADIVPQNGYGFNVPEPNFVDGYEAGDKRKAATCWVPGDRYPNGQTQPAQLPGSPNGYNVRKWFVGKVNTAIWDSELNVPVMRLAEVYLIKAEALGATPEGLEAINIVRRRAFGLPLNTPSSRDLTVNTANFADAVLRERRYELAFEDDRWFDLKRTNQLLTNAHLLAKGIQPFNVVMPIPQAEIDANNKLTQNPGY